MKKIGILIFAAALLLSIFVSSFFSFGRTGARIFSFSFGSGVRGSGKTAVETRDVTGFTGVDVGGVFQVEITAQKDFSVQIEGDDNLVPLVKTEVRGGILRIETGQRVSPSNALRVRISAPNIDNIEASGVAKVDLSGVQNGQPSRRHKRCVKDKYRRRNVGPDGRGQRCKLYQRGRAHGPKRNRWRERSKPRECFCPQPSRGRRERGEPYRIFRQPEKRRQTLIRCRQRSRKIDRFYSRC